MPTDKSINLSILFALLIHFSPNGLNKSCLFCKFIAACSSFWRCISFSLASFSAFAVCLAINLSLKE
jgi:hypothetical protein